MTPEIAAIRFGTGPSPDFAPPDGAAAILAALAGPDAAAARHPMPDWDDRLALAVHLVRLRRDRDTGAGAEAYRRVVRDLDDGYHDDLRRAVLRGATARDGFRERLAWFWADHFTVADGRGFLRRTVSSYQEAAIRPHVAGRFGDMLVAAVTHPAMIAYLDQDRSIGPNSPRGRRGGGLNENLAREVLELHTLGADAGAAYGQGDVRQLAELLTGLTLDRDGGFVFRRNFVEPGAETVLGRSYGGDRPDRHDVAEVLGDLAVHPLTARHVSRKLAVHFVADGPDGGLVADMTRAWLETGGDLMAVYAAMLGHPSAAAPELRKVRRPLDYVTAGIRLTGLAPWLQAAPLRDVRRRLSEPLARMGQPWQRPRGPDGWPEAAEAWATAPGLAARLDWAMDLARLPDPAPDPRALLAAAFGPLASSRTRFAAEAAEDRATGLGLILCAPEMMRR